jgi:hypothetical protein
MKVTRACNWLLRAWPRLQRFEIDPSANFLRGDDGIATTPHADRKTDRSAAIVQANDEQSIEF